MTTPGPGSSNPSDKSELRRLALARRDALPPKVRTGASAAIAERLATLSLPPGPVAAYWPIRSEVDPRPAARVLRSCGHAIALPRVVGERLEFHAWTEGDPLLTAPLGLMEPGSGAPAIEPATLLVPLAAFDRRGHRLGYGRGFYDRAIPGLGGVTTIGIAFAAQEIDLLPDEPHDHPLDFVVTEREIIDTRALRGS